MATLETLEVISLLIQIVLSVTLHLKPPGRYSVKHIYWSWNYMMICSRKNAPVLKFDHDLTQNYSCLLASHSWRNPPSSACLQTGLFNDGCGVHFALAGLCSLRFSRTVSDILPMSLVTYPETQDHTSSTGKQWLINKCKTRFKTCQHFSYIESVSTCVHLDCFGWHVWCFNAFNTPILLGWGNDFPSFNGPHGAPTRCGWESGCNQEFGWTYIFWFSKAAMAKSPCLISKPSLNHLMGQASGLCSTTQWR